MTPRLFRIAFVALAALATAAVGPSASIADGGDFRDETPHHVARDGDTLWSLSQHYFGDALHWPQLWAWNPHVTNPHWIYPGDVIFLGPRTLVPMQRRSQQPHYRDAEEAGMYFPLGGFITSREVDTAGTLLFARTDRRLLQPLDEVYIEFNEPEHVRVGDEFVINRIEGRIQGERRRDVVGVKYRTTGRIRVVRHHEETDLVTAEITALYETIERDDLLFVAQPQLLLLETRENTVDLDATIIDRLDFRRVMHQYHYVFVDKGREDGVRVGNRFFIWMREDGAESIRLARSQREYDRDVRSRLPWQLVGEAIVIVATEQYSTAVIISANHEVELGMRVTMQSGH